MSDQLRAGLQPGPAPTGRDKLFDILYGALGGKPENRWSADKLTSALDWGTLGLLTGAYDGGAHVARTGDPSLLGMALLPGAKVAAPVVKAAAGAVTRALPSSPKVMAPPGTLERLEITPRKQNEGIRAFHGSPHDFDRFDMSKVGTGEGAQAYGHGLYFTETEGVARHYRDDLSGHLDVEADLSDNAWGLLDEIRSDYGGKLSRQEFDQGLHYSQFQFLDDPRRKAAIAELKKAADSGLITFGDNAGRVYEVNIKADPEDFLDWDRPVAEQSGRVRGALQSGRVRGVLPQETHGMTGAQLHAKLRAVEALLQAPGRSEAAVRDRLSEAGIPGIRYLDGNSRRRGEGTRNYVVFDDALIEILRKYGILPPAVLGGGLLTTEGGDGSPGQ